jgi:hypothetical protein
MQVSGVDLLACGSIPTLPATQTITPSTKHPISDSVCKYSLQISHLSVYQGCRVMNELSRTHSETFPVPGLHAPSSTYACRFPASAARGPSNARIAALGFEIAA